MTRALRLNQVHPGSPHHIILRGNNRRNLFSNRADRGLLLRLVEQALVRTGCSVHHFTILTNHVHLVMTPPATDNLSACIKYFSQSYARLRNQRRQASGKLFEQRFFAKAITSNSYMATVAAYVDLNAKYAAMPPRYADYSALGLHTGQHETLIPRDLWTPSEWYLNLASSPEDRQLRYREWIDEYLIFREQLHDVCGLATLRLPVPIRRTRHVARPDRRAAY